VKRGARLGEPPRSFLRHDLIRNGPRWVDLEFEEKKGDAPERFAPESAAATKERQAGIRRTKPTALIICDLNWFEWGAHSLPPDHP